MCMLRGVQEDLLNLQKELIVILYDHQYQKYITYLLAQV